MKKVNVDLMLGRASKCHWRKITPKTTILRLILPSAVATQSPDLRTLLARFGLDTTTICDVFNNQTKQFWIDYLKIPAFLIINSNKSFIIELETPSIATFFNFIFNLKSTTYTPNKLPQLKLSFIRIFYTIILVKENENFQQKDLLKKIRKLCGSYQSMHTVDVTRRLIRKFNYKKKKKKITMITLHQLKKGARIVKKFTTKTPAFYGNPYKRGICLRLDIITPKKPNSAQRKTAKIRLCNGRDLIAYIPGMGHNITKHSEVLVRGGRVPDLPGVRYHLVRQKYSFTAAENFNRKARRSKFATKKQPQADENDSEDTE